MWIVNHYIFNIYEVNYRSNPDILFADNISEFIIEAAPINACGWKVPLRKIETDFEIIEGNDLVEVIEYNRNIGIIKLKVKNSPGIVVVRAKSKYSLLPSLIEIKIHSNNV